MVSQAITFFTAGFETTSNLMGFAMYELSFRQDCQDKLRQEIIHTFPNEESEITFDKIQQMQYLDMVIAGKFFCQSHLVYCRLIFFRNITKISVWTVSKPSMQRRVRHQRNWFKTRKRHCGSNTFGWYPLRSHLLQRSGQIRA